MAIVQLYIYSENEVFEIDVDDFELSTVFSVENIKNIESRKDNVTKDIVIKGTKKNKQAFSFLENLSRSTASSVGKELGAFLKPNAQVNCQLFSNNIQIMKGKLVVNNSEVKDSVSTYNCTITGNVINFFKNLNERYLHELDSLSKLYFPTTFNYQNIENSWRYDDYNIGFFPQIDYGIDNRTGNFDTYDNSFNIYNYRPAYYVEAYLKAIFKGFRYDDYNKKYTQLDENNEVLDEYKLVFNDLANTLHKSFIPNNDEQFVFKNRGEWITLYWFDINATSQVGWESLINISNKMYGISTNKYLSKYTVNNWQMFKKNGYTVTVNELEVMKIHDKYLNTTVNISCTVTVPKASTGTWLVGLATFDKSKTLDSSAFKYYQKITKTQTSSAQTFQINYTSDSENIAGEYIFGYYRENQTSSNSTNDTGFFVTNTNIKLGKADVENNFLVQMNDAIKPFEYVPKDIKIIDFLKSLMTMFNLYMYEDKDNENTFVIESYNNFYKNIIDFNTTKTVDWSRKADWSNFKLSTNIALPKSYKYQYEEDDDMMNDFYRNRYKKNYADYEIEDKNGIEDSSELKVIFAPTINLNHSKDEKNMPVIYKADGLMGSAKEPYNSKIRILYNNGYYNTIEPYNTMAGDVVQNTGTVANYSSMIKVENNVITDSLLFGLPNEIFTNNFIPKDTSHTLFNKHYQYQVKELINSELLILEIDVLLNEIDINNLDFKNMVYLNNSKYGNAYFKLLEVDYKNSQTTSKVKLQKIIN